jgi:hypothetical protein
VDDGSPCFYFCCAKHHFHEALDVYDVPVLGQGDAEYLARQEALASSAYGGS